MTPAGWSVKRLKYLASMNQESLAEDGDPSVEFRYADITAVESGGRIGQTEQVVFEKAPSRARRLVHAGDTVVSTVRTYLKAIALIEDKDADVVFSTGFSVLRPGRELEPWFLWRALQSESAVGWIVSHSEGVGYPAIAPSELGNLRVPVPPISAQRAVAAFLDRKTAEIDALVARKERLLALLEEKRTALITRAVTKGVTPGVEMKESRDAWLGTVPAHWEVRPLKYLAVLQRGYDLPEVQREPGEVPVVSSGGITGYHSRALVRAPGVVTGRYGSVGAVFFIEDDFWPLNTALYVKEFWGNEPRFVAHVLSVLAMDSESGKSAVPGVDRNDLHVLRVAVPPVPEQRDILEWLSRRLTELDALGARVREVIALLREYRTALITAAVTGQVEVA